MFYKKKEVYSIVRSRIVSCWVFLLNPNSFLNFSKLVLIRIRCSLGSLGGLTWLKKEGASPLDFFFRDEMAGGIVFWKHSDDQQILRGGGDCCGGEGGREAREMALGAHFLFV